MLVLFAALAIAGTVLFIPRGRRTVARLRAQRLLMPACVAMLGALLAMKGALLLGGGLVFSALLWTGRTHRARQIGTADAATVERLRAARMLLGVSASADRDTITAAHRRLIARHHPDVGGSEGIAGSLNAARDLLLDHAVQ